MSDINIADERNVRVITTRQLIDDLNAVLSDLDALLKVTADQRGAAVAKVRARAGESVAAMKVKLAGAEAVMLNKGREATQMADAYLRKNPWRNMAIIAGLGLLAGLLIGRR